MTSLLRGAFHRAQDVASADTRPGSPACTPNPARIAPLLLEWAAKHGRHDLPWQTDPTPYRVWVSEVMLQQTQVATVIPYYERFMSRFPTLQALAAAPLDDVLHAWSGLGYYARARNLHSAAQTVVTQYGSSLPQDVSALQTLPGIGRSTAGAILALSRAQRHPILDGNARRVLARAFAVEGDPSRRETLIRLWTLADACTPRKGVAEYTQAVMDLGSSVCTRSRPRCEACPLGGVCLARRDGRQSQFPSPRRRVARPRRCAWALVIRDATGALLLQQRPLDGLWGGLWSLPQFGDEAAARGWLASTLPDANLDACALPPQRHTFTHYDLDLALISVSLQRNGSALQGCAWWDAASPVRVGLTRAVTQLHRVLCQDVVKTTSC